MQGECAMEINLNLKKKTFVRRVLVHDVLSQLVKPRKIIGSRYKDDFHKSFFQVPRYI